MGQCEAQYRCYTVTIANISKRWVDYRSLTAHNRKSCLYVCGVKAKRLFGSIFRHTRKFGHPRRIT
jgi:hypothetical protein